MWTFFKHFRRSSPKPAGFTLIELMVVMAIMVILTAVMLVRQSRFDSSTLLRSLSYSMALSLRSAQVYGTSVLGSNASQSNCAVGNFSAGSCYAPAYGVYFNGATSYLLFADVNDNGQYDSGIDVSLQTYQIGSGFSIGKYCGITNSSMHCGGPQAPDSSPLTWLVVYFKRPNPDARFKSSAGESYNGAYIQVRSNADPSNTHSITVSSTGEISVGIAGS